MLGLEQFVAAQLCTRDGLISARQWAMGEEVRSIAQPANASMKIPRRSMQYWSGSIVVAAIFIAFLAIGGHLGTVNVRYLFDDHDIGVYFRSSRWIVEGSILYNDVFSEYPLLANAIFAAIRYVTEATFPGNLGFQYLWVLMAGVIYALATIRVATFASLLSAAIWLAPASIYFALFRYDIYPAVATLFGLFAIRRRVLHGGRDMVRRRDRPKGLCPVHGAGALGVRLLSARPGRCRLRRHRCHRSDDREFGRNLRLRRVGGSDSSLPLSPGAGVQQKIDLRRTQLRARNQTSSRTYSIRLARASGAGISRGGGHAATVVSTIW